MYKNKVHLCENCHKVIVKEEGDYCRCCAFSTRVAYELEQEAGYQEWEFAVCAECGTWLNSCGECPNTNCGNSPFVGEDWE